MMTKTERRVAELKSRAEAIMRAAQPIARGTQVYTYDPSASAAAYSTASGGGGGGGGASSSSSSSASGHMEEEGDDPEARRIQMEYYAAKLKREQEEAERVRCVRRRDDAATLQDPARARA
jgi:hypothetical protein